MSRQVKEVGKMWILIDVDEPQDVGKKEHFRFVGKVLSMEKMSKGFTTPLSMKIDFVGDQVHPATEDNK